MSKGNSSAVVIIPPKRNWATIQEIRKIYDRAINRWMPHITLLYPFRPRSQFEEINETFSEICKQIKPFEVSFEIFNYFSQGHQKYTLWLDPEPNISIIKLQAEILKIVPDCDDVNKYKNGFKPHLSVGQIKGKNKLQKILSDLQTGWEEIKFMLTSIYFITREDNKNSKFQISNQMQFDKE